jgi:ferredoxin
VTAADARRLRADRETCIGSGNCARVAPQVFDQDDDGRVVVLPDVDLDGAAAAIESAAEGCPIGALTFD